MTARRALVTLFVLTALAAPATAQDPSPKQQAADMAGQLMSPFCPGRLLADCTSPDAGELRTAIAGRIAGGESAAAVKADLVRLYGAEILGAPAPHGVGLLAWLVPGVLGLASLVGVALKVARATGPGDRLALAAAGGGDARRLSQVDEELSELD
jgi:cytochrome c-type biogenesis protein CcmH/NrfF